MADVFISYSKQEPEVTKRLAAALLNEGFTVWWDTNLKSGENFRRVIMKELSEARAVIVIWTRASVQSEWVVSEADRAKHLDKLICLRDQHVTMHEIPPPFDALHTEFCDNFNAVLQSLARLNVHPGESAIGSAVDQQSAKRQSVEQIPLEIVRAILAESERVARDPDYKDRHTHYELFFETNPLAPDVIAQRGGFQARSALSAWMWRRRIRFIRDREERRSAITSAIGNGYLDGYYLGEAKRTLFSLRYHLPKWTYRFNATASFTSLTVVLALLVNVLLRFYAPEYFFSFTVRLYRTVSIELTTTALAVLALSYFWAGEILDLGDFFTFGGVTVLVVVTIQAAGAFIWHLAH